MKKTIWRTGPPPSPGWWPASSIRDKQSIRWWNGKVWSFVAWPQYDSEIAALHATLDCGASNRIEWTDRWWL